MPKTPKPTETESEMAEIRRSLTFLCKSFDEIKERNKATNKRITELLDITKAKDVRVAKLEAQVNDLDQNSKTKNIIITGLNIRRYAATATANPKPSTRSSASTPVDEPPTISECGTMRTNFVSFAKKELHVTLELYDITAIHDLPPGRDGKRPIIVQLSWKPS